MPLVPLTIPLGVYRNGTDYQFSGRWSDVSLFRWIDGPMQPVGGWTERVTVVAARTPERLAAAAALFAEQEELQAEQ